MTAILHPTFKARDYKIDDTTPFPIRLIWKTPGADAMQDEE